MAGEYAAHFRVIPDADTALEEALGSARSDDAIFITGSLYLVESSDIIGRCDRRL